MLLAGVLIVQLVLYPMPVGAWIQGLVLGLLNALVVLGLMLVYRGNRVLNLAQASLGAAPAALGVGLILLGGLGGVPAALLGLLAGSLAAATLLGLGLARPIVAAAVGAATTATVVAGLLFADRLGYFGGLSIGVIAAIIAGAGVHLLVVKRLRNSPKLILTVATVGLAQLFGVLALLVPRLWGASLLINQKGSSYGIPWQFEFTVTGQVFRADDVVAAVVASACLVVVAVLLRRSELGMAIRGCADSPERAGMLGIPVLRLEAGIWITASVLSFLGVFLQGAILGFPLTATIGLTTLLTALAAMAIGGFDDLTTTLLAAVAVGVLSKGVAWNSASRPATVYAVLALVVLVVLLLRRVGVGRSQAGSANSWQAAVEPRAVPTELRRLPEVRIARWLGALAALVIAASLPLALRPSGEFRAATVLALAILGLSVVVLTGWAGEITLGQMAFAAAGAAVGALATNEWQFDLSLALICAAVAGAVAALVVGLPSLRFHGLFLAVTTLAFALAATGTLLNPTVASWIPTQPVDRRPLFALWDLSGSAAMYEVCLAVLVLCLAAMAGIRRSRTGRALRAVRDNERSAEAFGIRAATARLIAFAISGSLAGVAGCLLMYVSRGYDVGTFAAVQGLNVFISAVVGGVGSAVGAVAGAVLLDGARSSFSGPWALLPSAVGVLIVLLVLPGGFADILYRLRDYALRMVARRRGLLVPSLLAEGGGLVDPGEPPSLKEQPLGEVAASQERPPLLSLNGLTVAYGGTQVLFGIDLHVAEGEIVALLGTNGAGKSTVLRSIAGIAPMTGGTIQLDQQNLHELRPEQIAALGIAQMPGGHGVFPSLTVRENLRLAGWLIRHDRATVEQRSTALLDRFEVLASRLEDRAADLSGGQQQQLALAMALLTRPRLLLVDELSLGLAPSMVNELRRDLRELCRTGTTIVVVDQSVDLALSLADRAYFMEKGVVRFAGPARKLIDHPELLRSVFLHGAGRGTQDLPARDRRPITGNRANGLDRDRQTALEIQALSISFGGISAVDQVDLSVEAGEIVGLIGPNGAGKTTLFDLASGFVRADSGRILLHGRDIADRPPAQRSRMGLGRSFQDARLFAGLTVSETIAVALERWIQVGDPLSAALRLPTLQLTEAAVTARVDELIDLFGLPSFRDKLIGELSTGTRRIVDLACVVAHGPSVILLDEPSSGIAQSEAEALAPLLLRLRTQLGASLLVVEHDISLLSTIADRLVALDQGRVLSSGDPDEVLADPQVVASYLGTPNPPATH